MDIPFYMTGEDLSEVDPMDFSLAWQEFLVTKYEELIASGDISPTVGLEGLIDALDLQDIIDEQKTQVWGKSSYRWHQDVGALFYDRAQDISKKYYVDYIRRMVHEKKIEDLSFVDKNEGDWKEEFIGKLDQLNEISDEFQSISNMDVLVEFLSICKKMGDFLGDRPDVSLDDILNFEGYVNISNPVSSVFYYFICNKDIGPLRFFGSEEDFVNMSSNYAMAFCDSIFGDLPNEDTIRVVSKFGENKFGKGPKSSIHMEIYEMEMGSKSFMDAARAIYEIMEMVRCESAFKEELMPLCFGFLFDEAK